MEGSFILEVIEEEILGKRGDFDYSFWDGVVQLFPNAHNDL